MRLAILILTSALVGCGFGMRPEATTADPLPVSLGSLSACEADLYNNFSQGFRPFLLQNCSSCHISGGAGKGPFADDDPGLAFTSFRLATGKKVSDYAIDDAHQPPFSGARHTALVAGLRPSWNTAQATYDSCIVGGGPAPTPAPSEPWKSSAKVVTATTTAKTVAWSFQTEILPNSSSALPAVGASRIEFSIRTTTTPVSSYQISVPRVFAGALAVRVADIRVYLNGVAMNQVTTYNSIDRRIPIAGNRTLSSGTMVIETPVSATDTIAFSFGIIEPTTFNPPTYTTLRGATGPFGMSCTGCHSGGAPSAGLDLTNYNAMISSLRIVPFQPNNSPVLSRMKNTAFPMPPSGLLPAASAQQVQDWILDGAPNN